MQTKRVIGLFLILSATLSLRAQEKAPAASRPPQSPPSAGLVNDWLRSQRNIFTNFDLGGQVRARFEHRKHYSILGEPGSADFLDAPGVKNDNTFLLLREKVHVGYSPFPWVGAFAEARDSSSHNDQRNPNVEADTFDLHQGFVTLGNKREFPIVAKVGRQELAYGDERLVGASDWGNLGRVFDAAKLRWEQDQIWVDGFVGRVVLPNDDEFNEPNYYDWFSGVYASTRWVPRQVTDLYFLSRNVQEQSTQQITTSSPNGGATQRDVYTIGLRAKSLPGEFNGWDYSAEMAGQFGDFAMTAAGPRLNHTAFAAYVAGGFTWEKVFGKPRLGLEYNYASGDSDPNDGKHETFDNLFPTNHRYYGFMDFVSWQNIHDLRLSSSLKPLKKLGLTLDYHVFWLADTSDFFYQVNGAPRRTNGYTINENAGNFVGSEIDLVATYTFTRWASLQVGYGHFFVGDYVKDSLTSARAEDANFAYVQVVLNF